MSERVKRECFGEEETSLYVCKNYAESLPYPAVLIDSEGNVSYKNSKFKCINLKWRIGAKIKHYIGAEYFLSLRGLKMGTYVAIPNLGVGAVGLKVGEFSFIVFLPKFEIHDTFAEMIYNYIANIPEKDFFEIRNLEFKGDKSDETYHRWEKFKKGFNKFYLHKCYYDLEISHLFDGVGHKKAYSLLDVIDGITNTVNDASSKFGYSIRLSGREAAGNCLVDASAEDICAVLSIAFFLCARCASAKNPIIKLDFQKALPVSSVDRLCFSVKSEIATSELNMNFKNDISNNEISLYFNTLKHLASKYFWGIRVCRGETELHFIILLASGTSSSDLWLNDSVPYDNVEIDEMFLNFSDLTELY